MWKENANKGGNNGRFDRYYAEKTIDGVRYRFRSTSKHNVERWESIIKLIFSHYTLPRNIFDILCNTFNDKRTKQTLLKIYDKYNTNT